MAIWYISLLYQDKSGNPGSGTNPKTKSSIIHGHIVKMCAGANPTTAIYNASAVKVYNAMSIA
jgi:hypothetical protein